MIRVLVMATDSFLADYVVAALSKEPGIEVLRVTRDELGSRKDYSAVIVMDDAMDETESIKLKEFVQKDKSLLLMRLSSGNKVISVDETYRLVNPGIDQIVDLLEAFDRKTLTTNSDDTASSQKKMNKARNIQADKYGLQPVFLRAEDSVICSPVHPTLRIREYVTLPITTYRIEIRDAIKPHRLGKYG
jgi:hypothetical protein